MRPLPEEVIADVRWTLDNVIRPALEDGFAIEQAGLMSNLLEHVRLRLSSEARLLREDSDDVRDTLHGLPLPAALQEQVAAVPGQGASAGVEGLREENDQLRALLQRCVAASERAAEEGDEQARAALPAIRALLRRQLDRERQMLGPGYAAGT